MDFLNKQGRLWMAAAMIVLTLTACGGAEERKAKYMERGKAYFEEANYEKAAVEFKNVLQIDPKSAEPYYYMGRIAEHDNDWAKVLRNYSRALDMDPGLLPARVRLGRIYLLGSMIDKATEQADEILAREPEHPDGLALRAAILFKQDHKDEAAAILRKVLEAEPGNEAAAILMGAYLGEQQDLEGSVAVLEAAIAANPDSEALLSNLISYYVENGQTDRAEQAIKDMVRRYPDNLQYQISLSSFYLNTQQEAKAEQALRAAISAKPDDVQRYLLLANMIKNTRGMQPAIEMLESSVQEKPDLAKLRFSLVSFYLEDGQQDRAEKLLKEVIDRHGLDPDGIYAHAFLASMLYDRGEIDAAKAHINSVLEENPKDNTALLLQARIALKEKEYPEAIAALRTVLKDQPDSTDALILLASAHEANGDKALALETLNRAVATHPEKVEPRLQLARFYALDRSFDKAIEQLDIALRIEPRNVTALRIKSEVFAKTGDTEGLEQVLTQLEQAMPESGLGAFGKGRMYKSQGKYDEAIAAFEEALQHEEESAVALSELVNIELGRGNPDAAIRRVQAILDDNPGFPGAHYLLATAYTAKEDYDAAESELFRQLEISPRSSSVYTGIASVRLMRGENAGVEEILRKGVDAIPDNSKVLLDLAGFLESSGRVDEAETVYREGRTKFPQDYAVAVSLAEMYRAQGDVEKAISAYEDFNSANPGNLLIINNLVALLADFRTDEASLARAKELAGKLQQAEAPAILDTVGWANYRVGQYDKAAEILSGVVEKEPDVPVFRYHLGMTYYRQGDLRAAGKILSGVVGEELDYPGVDEARKTYAEISDQ